MNIQRFAWEDALIEAEAIGELSAGALNTALRLAKVIYWSSKKPAGLYWANELAAEIVGISRASYFRNIKELKIKQYFVLDGTNLIANIPETQSKITKIYQERLELLKSEWNKKKLADKRKQENQSTTASGPTAFSLTMRLVSLKMILDSLTMRLVSLKMITHYSDIYKTEEDLTEEDLSCAQTTVASLPSSSQVSSDFISDKEELQELPLVDTSLETTNTSKDLLVENTEDLLVPISTELVEKKGKVEIKSETCNIETSKLIPTTKKAKSRFCSEEKLALEEIAKTLEDKGKNYNEELLLEIYRLMKTGRNISVAYMLATNSVKLG